MPTSTPGRATLLATCLALVLGACGSDSPDPAPTPSGSPLSPGVQSGLRTIEPTVVEGLTSTVGEDMAPGSFTYVTLPVVPGAAPWTDQLRKDLAPQLAAFRDAEAALDQQPLPELHVSWDLVGASPAAIGVRTVTSELGADRAFDGEVAIRWWDPSTAAERPSGDLIEPAAVPRFLERVLAAAQANPEVVTDEVAALEAGGLAQFDAIAFTGDGDLFVEFDRHEVSEMNSPVGLAIDEAGLLSAFGAAARTAAMSPSDPGLARAGSQPPSDGGSPIPSSPSSPSSPGGAPVDCAKVKCAALTFDDGPVEGTNDLLDVLAEKDVDVTFFTVGSNVENHPEILARMVADGHVVGNHTHDHPQLTRLGPSAIRSQIKSTNDLIESATGSRPTLLRPPYGATNARVGAVAEELGMAQINWNVDPEDWKDRNSAVVEERVLASTRNGSIVLSHDIHETTRAAYADIIDGLRAKGFTLVTVPELLGDELTAGKVYYNR